MKLFRLLLSLPLVAALMAHPMGNFSVSHYTKIAVGPRGADMLYVLDLAEIPTLETMQRWKPEPGSVAFQYGIFFIMVRSPALGQTALTRFADELKRSFPK